MVLELSKSFTHSCGTKEQPNYSEKELKEIMLKLMTQNGIDSNKINLNQDGVLQVDESSNLKLHRIMLKAEELGLTMKYTKKTLIEVC